MKTDPTINLLQRFDQPNVRLIAASSAGLFMALSYVILWTKPFGGSSDLSADWIAGFGLVLVMYYGARAAIDSVRAGKFDIDVLMVVGAVAAASLGELREATLLLFLFVLSGALEDLAEERTNRSVTALSKLMPSRVFRYTGAGKPNQEIQSLWQDVKPTDLAVGDIIRVIHGESLAADGVLISGTASLDQASLTGESVLRNASEGEKVFSGTMNAGATLMFRVTARPIDSALQRVIYLVTQAQQQRQPIEQYIDRFSQPYSLGVMAAAIATLIAWRFGLSRSWYESVFTAITLLIVASPCALIIATPTAALAAIARGARSGVLFKGGQAITRLAGLTSLAMDKTGTITEGKPKLLAVLPMPGVSTSDVMLEPDQILSLAAALEQHSTHPVAAAITEAAAKGGVPPTVVVDARVVTGKGIIGTFNGQHVRIGSGKFIAEVVSGLMKEQVAGSLAEAQKQGHIAVVLSIGEQAAVLIFGDTERPGMAEAIVALRTMGVRPIVMLTGDNRHTAAVVAKRVGVDECFSELQPEDKVDHLMRMKRSGGRIGLVGDGINDAPALAAADVSLAMGTIGSQAAMESADIVLIRDQASLLPWSVSLARRAVRTVKINIAFSLGAIVCMVLATLIGGGLGFKFPLWMGVLGHEGGTLLVVGHSLLLLSFRPPTFITR